MRHSPINTHVFHHGGKELAVVAVNLQSAAPVPSLPKAVKGIFDELSLYLKNPRQVAYLRDIPELAAGRHLVGGARHPQEIQIASPKWPADEEEIIYIFAHELHHLVRRQSTGAGLTLSGYLAAEGAACAYAETKSAWRPAWIKGRISQQVYDQARLNWGKRIDYHAWFVDGPLGKWVGYRLGYTLAKQHFGEEFDLAASVRLAAHELKPFLK